MIEYARNAPKKMDVDILFSKYFINIRAGTAQLRSKPSDRTSLLVERAFNKLPRMNHTIFVYAHTNNYLGYHYSDRFFYLAIIV